VADGNTGKLKEQLDNKVKELEEIKQKLTESKAKELKETQSITTRLENLEDKVKPQFKAHTLASKEAENTMQEYPVDPNKKVKN
jgi:predicted nuclease with TOPRIM domain